MEKAIGKVDQAQIDKWKKEHLDVRQCVQKDEDGNTHYSYFRLPKIPDKEYAGTVGGDNGLSIGAALLSQVRLGGSEAVLEDDRLKQGLMAQVLKYSKPIAGEVTKL